MLSGRSLSGSWSPAGASFQPLGSRNPSGFWPGNWFSSATANGARAATTNKKSVMRFMLYPRTFFGHDAHADLKARTVFPILSFDEEWVKGRRDARLICGRKLQCQPPANLTAKGGRMSQKTRLQRHDCQ